MARKKFVSELPTLSNFSQGQSPKLVANSHSNEVTALVDGFGLISAYLSTGMDANREYDKLNAYLSTHGGGGGGSGEVTLSAIEEALLSASEDDGTEFLMFFANEEGGSILRTNAYAYLDDYLSEAALSAVNYGLDRQGTTYGFPGTDFLMYYDDGAYIVRTSASEYLENYFSSYISDYISEYFSDHLSDIAQELWEGSIEGHVSAYISEYLSAHISDYASDIASTIWEDSIMGHLDYYLSDNISSYLDDFWADSVQYHVESRIEEYVSEQVPIYISGYMYDYNHDELSGHIDTYLSSDMTSDTLCYDNLNDYLNKYTKHAVGSIYQGMESTSIGDDTMLVTNHAGDDSDWPYYITVGELISYIRNSL